MIDTFVVPQTVQRAVYSLTNVTDWLLGRSHVNVLYMALQTRQRRQVLVARIASKILAAQSSQAPASAAATIIVIVVVMAAVVIIVVVVMDTHGRRRR